MTETGLDKGRDAAECAPLIRQYGDDPPADALTGCPMGRGGTFIHGGEGDDRVIIEGDPGQPVWIDGGPGRDTTVMRQGAAPIAGAADGAGLDGGVVLLLALLVMAALIAFVSARALRR